MQQYVNVQTPGKRTSPSFSAHVTGPLYLADYKTR